MAGIENKSKIYENPGKDRLAQHIDIADIEHKYQETTEYYLLFLDNLDRYIIHSNGNLTYSGNKKKPEHIKSDGEMCLKRTNQLLSDPIYLGWTNDQQNKDKKNKLIDIKKDIENKLEQYFKKK